MERPGLGRLFVFAALPALPLIDARGIDKGIIRSHSYKSKTNEALTVSADGFVSYVSLPQSLQELDTQSYEAEDAEAEALGSVDDFYRDMSEERRTQLSSIRAATAKALDAAYGRRARTAFGYEIDPGYIADEVERKVGNRMAAWYSEVEPESMVKMLQGKLQLEPSNPPKKFYDLGSGFGKVTSLAWLLGMDATGVEIATARLGIACSALEKLPSRPSDLAEGARNIIRFIQGDATTFDYSDADVVFTDATMFTDEIIKGEGSTARHLKHGAFVISPQGLHAANLKEVGNMTMPSTWADDSLWRIQKVVASPMPSSLVEGLSKEQAHGRLLCQKKATI